jgi:hypothetical protein
MEQYREAGLISPSTAVSGNHQTPPLRFDGVPNLLDRGQAVPIAEPPYRPVTFVAYWTRQTSIDTLRGDRFGASERFQKTLCGTVTLLVPSEEQSRVPIDGYGLIPNTQQNSGNRQSDRISEGAKGEISANETEQRIGKVTRLAIANSNDLGRTGGQQTVFFDLTAVLYQTALEMGVTHFDFIVHPRHAKLYERIFNANPVGAPFRCEEAGGNPAQFLRTDITNPDRIHARLRRYYAAACRTSA